MKKFFIVAIAMLSITSMGCLKKCGSVPSAPEAPVEHDNSNKGVYKGVLTGSTGHFKMVVNDDNTSTITLTFNGKTVTMTGKGVPVGGGKTKYVFNDAGYNFETIIASDGRVLSSKFSAPGGKTAKVTIVKEKSNEQVLCFEGTYSGDSTGTWNMVIRGTSITGSSHDTASNSTRTFAGKLKGNSISLKGHRKDSGQANGTRQGDNVSGSWTGGGQSGPWSGKRTL
jgi:hypothetical protein